jgi:hypothetical protein
LHHRRNVFHRMLRSAFFHRCRLDILARLGGLAVATIARRTAVAVATSRLLAAWLLVLVFLAFRTIPATTTPTATTALFACAFRPLGTFTGLALLHCRERLLLLLGTFGALRTRRPLLAFMLLALAAFLVAMASLAAIATFAFRARALVAVFAASAAFAAAFGP